MAKMIKLQIPFLLLAVLLPLLAFADDKNSLIPPVGNSLALISKALNGVQVYRCVDGDWLLESAYAKLVDSQNPSNLVGNYSFVKNPLSPKDVGTWNLFNTLGDHAESGCDSSSVSGKIIAKGEPESPQDLPDYLAQASKHEQEGAAAMVSYIARVNSKGGRDPKTGFCNEETEAQREVPFDAKFHFWKQDLVPPSSMPPTLYVPDRALQGFFGEGIVTYVYDNETWQQTDVSAVLYDVPGGTRVGWYYMRRGNSSFCWQFDDPNGFEILAKPACSPVAVSPNHLPWALLSVTSTSRAPPMFGSYSHVQMVSTYGGLPPRKANWKPKKAQVWKASFSAIYWIYCRKRY